MAIVDTSFLVALHFDGDGFHQQAIKHRLVGDRFLVPSEIWAEYADVVLRLAVPSRVRDVLRSTLEGPFDVQSILRAKDYALVAERAVGARTWAARMSRRPLSVFDLVVCFVAERFREPVLTFDEGMAAAIRAKLFPGARLA